jgi:hypothetical protein
MEEAFGVDFSAVRVHVGPAAHVAAARLSAQALTIGNDLIFHAGAYRPGTPEGNRLLAHELAHVVQQADGRPRAHEADAPPGDIEVSSPDQADEQVADAVSRQIADEGRPLASRPRQLALGMLSGPVAASRVRSPSRTLVHRQPLSAPVAEPGSLSTFPWNGRIAHTWTAALRSTPHKDPADPHRGTVADLDVGTDVLVVNRKSGWLKVQLADGRAGWVSHELVEYVSPAAITLPEVAISVHVPTVAEAFILLKRAELAKSATPAYTPAGDDADDLELAESVLEKTGKYTVDRATYRVSFTPTGKKFTVDTIEDFILFVETVERTYPAATPGEVASEIRQIWFSDANWRLLSAGTGIAVAGKEIDIETEPNSIALAFNMKDLAPAHAPSKAISTPMGTIGMGHVLAGIDTAINGFPTAAAAGATSGDAALKYGVLATATAGDPRDFATWAGDLGQAYGDYLVDRYIRGNASAKLSGFIATEADPDALTADIHGYIAAEVTNDMPGAGSPTGSAKSVSAILRNLYLVPKTAATGLTYRQYFEKVTGKTGPALDTFMQDRILAFARPWFAKKTVDSRGGWPSQKGWTKSGILENALSEFDTYHKTNEDTQPTADRVAATVTELNRLLSGSVK